MALSVELVQGGNWQVRDGENVIQDNITTREEADAFVAGHETAKSGNKGSKASTAKPQAPHPDFLPDSPAASGRPSPQRLKSPSKAEEAGPDVIERHVEESNEPGDTKPNRDRVPDKDEPTR